MSSASGTERILREHHANRQHGDEKAQIIKTTLKFICNDIAMIDLDPKSYLPQKARLTSITSRKLFLQVF